MSTFFSIYKATVNLNLFLVNIFLQRTGDMPVLLTKKLDKSIEETSLLYSAENIQNCQGSRMQILCFECASKFCSCLGN